MKLGFGLYYHMLDSDHFKFARQCGATHVAVHLTDYFNKGDIKNTTNQPVGTRAGWGLAGSNPHVWEYEYLHDLCNALESHGLTLEAVENFDPADWYAVLLDLPEKQKQMERLKQIIKNVGKAGIGIFGYNFSLAGVSSRMEKPSARGDAMCVVMEEVDTQPIPMGMVWNMTYDESLLQTGVHPSITHEELWQRFEWFLAELVPVAEENNVRLAAHPDDPPAEFVRTQPRLVYKAKLYQRLLDSMPSHANAQELCLGTMQEMPDMKDENGVDQDIVYWVDRYAKQKSIAYVHFRNIRGKAPQYQESFVDDGDIPMEKIVAALKQNEFTGMLIPDHSPQMTCPAPWHAGMAYAMGYMKALLQEAK